MNDEDPRQTAWFAWNALVDVIKRHPDVTTADVEAMEPTLLLLRKLYGEKDG